MKNNFYIDFKSEEIKLINGVKEVVFYAKREPNGIGRTKTVINFETGVIDAICHESIFSNHFSILKNTTDISLEFINESKILKINGSKFEMHRRFILDINTFVLVNKRKVAKFYPSGFFSTINKIEMLDENIDIILIFIYLSVTYDVLI